MAGFEYRRRTVANGSVLRRILLFGVIGLLTCGGLWVLAPSGEEKKAQTVPSEKPPVEAAGDEAAGSLPSNPEQNSGTVSPGKEQSAPAVEIPGSEEKTEAEQPAETTPEPEARAGEKPETGATAVPEKDRPWIGDVPAAEDAPLVPPDQPEARAGVTGAGNKIGAPVPYSAAWRKRAKTLTEENWSLLCGKGPGGPGTVSHKVISGDSLNKLAVKYHCTADAIRLCNGLKTDRIRVGMTLKLVPGPWRVEVSKSARVLAVFRNRGEKEELFLAADVGIGRQGKTPTADFTICARLRHPAWHAPDGGVCPYGDARNPLGEYFLKLAAAGRKGRLHRGFGIHGTRDEAAVTRSRSNGCIRMRNRDVKRLYLLLPVGTPVRIVD